MKKVILLASFVFASISSLHAAADCCSTHASSASAEPVKPVQMEKAEFPAEGVTAEYVQKAEDAGCPATAMLQARMKAAAAGSSCCATEAEAQQASAKPVEEAAADACCAAELASAQAESATADDCCAEKSDCAEDEECTVVAADTSAEESEAAQG